MAANTSNNGSNSVFLSYRRDASNFIVLAIYQELVKHNIDAFYDIESLNVGQFEEVILNQIAARPYFVPLLTPETLERCANPGDWVLREFEHAMQHERIFVPLYTQEFDLADIDTYLPAEIARYVRKHQMIELPTKGQMMRFFSRALEDFATRVLLPVTLPSKAISAAEQHVVTQKKAEIAAQPPVTENQLTADEWFQRARGKRNKNDLKGAIADYTQALNLNPKNTTAYKNRGNARKAKGDLDEAIADFTKVLEFDPKNYSVYNRRGLTRSDKGDWDGAIADYTQAIALNPKYVDAYSNRGYARQAKGDLNDAIADYTQALALNSHNDDAYYKRGNARDKQGDFKGAAQDYRKALEIDPANPDFQALKNYIEQWEK